MNPGSALAFQGSLARRRLEYLYWAPQLRGRRSDGVRGLAITGCGRSGTTYSTMRLAELGVQIGHERLARHGISSWYIAPRTAERCVGPSAVEIEALGLPLVHQVRHPLTAVASIATIGERSWEFVARYIDVRGEGPGIVRSMKYWLQWNLLAAERAVLTYQVEDFDASVSRLLDLAGAGPPPAGAMGAPKTPSNLNTREHPPLDWTDLEAADRGLAREIAELAKAYGYEV